jgi:AcrR family transcriptional regulator
MERLTRTEQQARTRARLLDVGRRIFADRGFAAATVEEITELAGVTRGALYKHFDGKEGLFLALAVEAAEKQLGDWSADGNTALTDEQHLGALTHAIEGVDIALGRAHVEFVAHIRSRPRFHSQVMALQRETDARTAVLLRHMCDSLGLTLTMPMDDLLPLVLSLANGLLLRSSLDPDLDVPRLLRTGLVGLLTGASTAVPTTEEATDDRL